MDYIGNFKLGSTLGSDPESLDRSIQTPRGAAGRCRSAAVLQQQSCRMTASVHF